MSQTQIEFGNGRVLLRSSGIKRKFSCQRWVETLSEETIDEIGELLEISTWSDFEIIIGESIRIFKNGLIYHSEIFQLTEVQTRSLLAYIYKYATGDGSDGDECD